MGEDRPQNVRLLRPYLPDGTPIFDELEGHYLRIAEQHLRMEEQHRREVAEARAEAETQRRQEALAELELLR